MGGEGGQRDVAEAMRRSLGSLQRKATPMHEKICSALTVAAEEEDAQLEKEFELACEVRAPSRGAARRISRGGLVDGPPGRLEYAALLAEHARRRRARLRRAGSLSSGED